MTTEVTISSKKPNHNPFRVRVIGVNQAKFNAAVQRALVDIEAETGHAVHVRQYEVNQGEVAESHRDYVTDTCVILIDEIR